MQNDILFDNIYIGHSPEDAEQLRKEILENLVKKVIPAHLLDERTVYHVSSL